MSALLVLLITSCFFALIAGTVLLQDLILIPIFEYITDSYFGMVSALFSLWIVILLIYIIRAKIIINRYFKEYVKAKGAFIKKHAA